MAYRGSSYTDSPVEEEPHAQLYARDNVEHISAGALNASLCARRLHRFLSLRCLRSSDSLEPFKPCMHPHNRVAGSLLVLSGERIQKTPRPASALHRSSQACFSSAVVKRHTSASTPRAAILAALPMRINGIVSGLNNAL